jgi:hypothetical protein
MSDVLRPSDRVSQAFFAAFVAAMKGDDKQAGDILRAVADDVLSQFKPEVKGNVPKQRTR